MVPLTSLKKRFTPQGYTLATSIISLGGFLNGYDTGSIGAVTTMPFFDTTFGNISPALRGFTVSLIMLMGAVPAFFAGQLAHRYGHLRVIMAGAAIFTIGAILEAASEKIETFLVGRALCGIGEGVWLTNVSVYICEIAPSSKRGVYVSVPQLMAVTGICTGYFTCYGSIKIDSSLSWRLPFILMAIGGAALAISCFYLPASPRWLLVHGRRSEALWNVERLNIAQAEAEKDILRPVEGEQVRVSMWKAVAQIFQRRYRMRTTLGLFVLGMVQLSGIDGVLYYAPILFTQAGLKSGTASFLASGVSAILMLAISIPAFLYADSWGRRTSVILGGAGLTFCMFVIGCLYASDSVHADTGVGRWLVIVLIFAFALTYTATWGIVGKIYASEVQPTQTRAAANSVAQGLGFFTNWLVAITTPIFLAESSYGAYFLFGGLALFTVIVLALFMPETRGHSLEAIQDAFQVPKAGRQVQKLISGLRFRGPRSEDEASSGIEMHGTITDNNPQSGVSSIMGSLTPQRVELSVAA